MRREFLILSFICAFFTGLGSTSGHDNRTNSNLRSRPANRIAQTKHDLFILSIGIHEYHNYGDRNPAFAEQDATDFANTLERVARRSFNRIHKTILIKEQTSKANIIGAITNVSAEARSDDTFVFFFSGHGTSLKFKTGEELFYLVPSDFDGSKDQITKKGISAVQLRYWLAEVPSNHQVVILDASKSDNGFNQFKDNIDAENKSLTDVARRDIIILSVKSWSFEFRSLGHGMLTYVVLEGLNGGAALENGEINAMQLASFVRTRTPAVLRRHANRRALQILKESPASGTPFVYSSGEDFLLGSVQTKSGGQNRGANQHALYATTPKPSQAAYKPKPECEAFSEKRPSSSTGMRKGKDIALLIAFNDYDHWGKLTSPIMDAEAVAKILHDRYDFETELLKNPPAMCIGDAIRRYKTNRIYEPDDQLFVYFTGHGHYDEDAGAGLLVQKESLLPEDDYSSSTYILQGIFRKRLSGIGVNHLLLVVDACFSGSIDEAVDAVESKKETIQNLPQGSSDEEFIERLLAFKTHQFVTSGDRDYVQAGNPGEHSPFASQFLAALNAKNEGHPFLTLSDIAPVIKRAPTPPRFGSWDSDRGRGDFIFFLH